MGNPKVYRPARFVGVIVILCGQPFIGIGSLGIYHIGLESAWFFGMFILVGSLVGVGGGLGLLTMRISVDEQGITKSYWTRVEFSASWAEIERWSVELYD